MTSTDWQDYIIIDPELHHGDACIKGTRIPVATIAASLAAGMGADQIIDAFPQLTAEQIQAVVSYLAGSNRSR
jgi:uncharacterized protein (DUF433 family)